MSCRFPIVGGNWKMNGSLEANSALVAALNGKLTDAKQVQVVVFPPAIYMQRVKEAAGPQMAVGCQNIWKARNGAFTGEISPPMLAELGYKWTLVGHSERRTKFGETDELLGEKTVAALKCGLSVTFCIGELLEERESGNTMPVVTKQLQALKTALATDNATKHMWGSIVIAYEPVWAIGTGKTASPEQAQEVHAGIRGWMAKEVSEEVAATVRIQYGGSVSGKNCDELAAMPDIDGFLVGGASLKADDFGVIVCSLKNKATTAVVAYLDKFKVMDKIESAINDAVAKEAAEPLIHVAAKMRLM